MNRRQFLAGLGSLPFLGFLPKADAAKRSEVLEAKEVQDDMGSTEAALLKAFPGSTVKINDEGYAVGYQFPPDWEMNWVAFAWDVPVERAIPKIDKAFYARSLVVAEETLAKAFPRLHLAPKGGKR